MSPTGFVFQNSRCVALLHHDISKERKLLRPVGLTMQKLFYCSMYRSRRDERSDEYLGSGRLEWVLGGRPLNSDWLNAPLTTRASIFEHQATEIQMARVY